MCTHCPQSESFLSEMADNPLAEGRAAILRHEWTLGFRLLKQADESGAIPADDLEAMGQAAWWVARPDEGIEALERAFAAHMQGGNRARAARVALNLAREYGYKLAGSVAAGWFNRAVRLLEEEPEGIEHGYLYLRQAVAAIGRNDFDEAIALSRHALEIGTKFGDADLQAHGLLYQGMALVYKGEAGSGMALMDEATVAAVNGELGPYATGVVYCNMVSTCRSLVDLRRAGEWSAAARRWCERQSITGWPGDCRVHQAEIWALRGAWAEAEEAARLATDELVQFNRLSHAGEGFYQIGEIRLRMGDLPAAEDALRQANELGRDPQPGLSLLLLAQGKGEAAAASIKRALEEGLAGLDRARLLPAAVEIALEAGDVDGAGSAAGELESIAAAYDAPALHAAAHAARGAVSLASGDMKEAVRTLRRGVGHWQDVDVPYEAARTRALLAQALRAHGDTEAALLELRAARAAFERLGALPDLKKTDETLYREAPPEIAPTSARDRKTLLFTDIVNSTNLIEVIGDDSWFELRRWHDQTLRSLFSAHSGEEVDHTGDGFFVAFDAAEEAVACAVAIQRTLAEHRREHGFAPEVRIGLHTARPSRVGRGYGGKSVHLAARLCALAGGGEIVASHETLDDLEWRFSILERRSVAIKGISTPVDVVFIEWR